MRGLGKKEGVVFLRGDRYPNANHNISMKNIIKYAKFGK